MNDLRTAPAVVVMGVAGCGKTAVGEALAGALGADFIEGDRLHPPENVARMARGEPLTDALREGWLDAMGEHIAASVAGKRKAVAACSALKRTYRERLSRFCPEIIFLYLKIDRETAWRRVANRKGHFMPASLVDSQFATLEEPAADERAVTVDGTRSVAGILKEIVG
ncbi:Thermoresistant glucokinase family carbohydrate kinase [Mesorhizobium plurifarium]|uniref:Gluconokinase n=1 Tax=Mesorhizobium plurifarium TaxID=69974 RepID=A0A090EGD3_MESPL|nr:Thermoresistant glucokinase family carbohydrate kinase [Mesorhizobium plurifarium]